MKTIKVGDRFKLGPWEMEVKGVDGQESLTAQNNSGCLCYITGSKNIEKIEWLKEPVKFTKEQKMEIVKQIYKVRLYLSISTSNSGLDAFKNFTKWLDEHTEK